jgi:hypothetical protein
MNKKVADYQTNYVIQQDSNFLRLDSALVLIDTMLCDCSGIYAGLITAKLRILSIECRYDAALDLINSLDSNNKIFPLDKLVLTKRFQAMKAQSLGNTQLRNSLIIEIKDYLNNYLYSNKSEVDSILQLSDIDDIMKYNGIFKIIGYYYYLSQIDGTEKALTQINTLKGNREFIDNWLKSSIIQIDWFNTNIETNLEENFMYYNGI